MVRGIDGPQIKCLEVSVVLVVHLHILHLRPVGGALWDRPVRYHIGGSCVLWDNSVLIQTLIVFLKEGSFTKLVAHISVGWLDCFFTCPYFLIYCRAPVTAEPFSFQGTNVRARHSRLLPQLRFVLDRGELLLLNRWESWVYHVLLWLNSFPSFLLRGSTCTSFTVFLKN